MKKIAGMIMGTASKITVDEANEKFGFVLATTEEIQAAYKVVRDMFIFTNKRLILINIQGVSGKKVEVQSVPYKSIVSFSVETAGTLDLDAELKIWISGSEHPIKKLFNKNVNIFEVQAILAEATAGIGK